MSEPAATESQPHPRSRFHVIPIAIVGVVLLVIALGVAWKGNALKPKPKLLLVTSTANPYWDRVIAGAEAAARQMGAELTAVRNKGDVKAQNQTIRDAISSGVSGIAVSPIDPTAQSSDLAEAARKVPLVTIDSDAPGSSRMAFIGTDNYFAGRQCGRLVKDAVPDGGEVVICVGSVNSTNGQDRRRGVIDVLMDRPNDPKRAADPVEGELKGTKYTVAATLIDGIDRTKARDLAAEAIAKHPNVKCLVGLFGYNTPAILEALEKAGKLGQVKVVGFDDAEATVNGIRDGHVHGSVVQDQYNMGFDSVMALWSATRGTSPQTTVGESRYLPSQEYTRENIEDLRLVRERGETSPSSAPVAPK